MPGNGHLGRVRSIIAALGTEATVLSSLPAPAGWSAGTAWVQLPRDDDGDGAPRDPEAGGVLHWAPLGHAGLRERMGAIAAWVTRQRTVGVLRRRLRRGGRRGAPDGGSGGRRRDAGGAGRPAAPARLRPGQPDPRPLAGGRLPPRLPPAAPAQDLLRRRHLPVRRSPALDRCRPRYVASGRPGAVRRPRKVLLLAGAGTTGTLSAQMRAVDEAATAAGWDVLDGRRPGHLERRPLAGPARARPRGDPRRSGRRRRRRHRGPAGTAPAAGAPVR